MNAKNIFSVQVADLFKQHSAKFNKMFDQISSKNGLIEDTKKVADEIYEKCKINFDVAVDFNSPKCDVRLDADKSSLNITTGYQQYAVVDVEFQIQGNADLLQYHPMKSFSLKNHRKNGVINSNTLQNSFGTQSQTITLSNSEKNKVNKSKKDWISEFDKILQKVKLECEEYNTKLQNCIISQIDEINKKVKNQI